LLINQANTWCTQGIELLASQNSNTPPDQALQELQQLIDAAEEFHHPRCIFQDSVMPETKALITQVRISEMFLIMRYTSRSEICFVGSAKDRGCILDVRQENNGTKAAVDQTRQTSTNRYSRTSQTLAITASNYKVRQNPQKS